MKTNLVINLKAFRKSKKLTQEAFGKIAGVTKKTVNEWENGNSQPRRNNIEAIANHFAIDTNTFYVTPEATPENQAQELIAFLQAWQKATPQARQAALKLLLNFDLVDEVLLGADDDNDDIAEEA